MSSSSRCAARTDDPLDQELAARLNTWDDERDAEWRQSLRPILVELAWWLVGTAAVAAATLVGLVWNVR